MARLGAAWKVSIASFIALNLSGAPLIIYTQGLFLEPMTSELGWTRAEYFLPLSIAGFVCALLTPYFGRVADRYGVRPILLPCIFLFGLAYASLGMVGRHLFGYSVLMFLVLIVQIAHGPLYYAKIVAMWPGRRPGLMLAIALAGNMAGGIIVPPIAEWLISNIGWRGARFALGAIVVVLCLPVVWAFVRSPALPATGRKEPQVAIGTPAAEAMREWSFWLIVAKAAFISMAVSGAVGNVVPIVVERGLTPAAGAFALSVLAGSALVARFASGWALDKSRTARIALPWIASGLTGMMFLTMVNSIVPVLVACALVGAILGSEINLAAYFIHRFFGLTNYGQLYGIVLAVYAIGATTGPLMFGIAYDLSNFYLYAILIACVMLVLSMLCVIALGPYRYSAALHE
jgi:MFS family permease